MDFTGIRDIADHVDVRADPLIVRDGCAPDRMPAGRWPSGGPLALSGQFAVNEIMAGDAPLTSVHAPESATPVFNDLIAAIVTERAAALAALPSPAAAFGSPVRWGPHSVSPPAPSLTGFEILLAGSGAGADAGADAYFPATARLLGGTALTRARLGDQAACRAFTDRFWHGRVHGSDVLFATGESFRAALRSGTPEAGGWPDSAARFRAALDNTQFLSSERIAGAETLARFSALEAECERAYSRLETSSAEASALAIGEPAAREAVIAAEERRRAALDDLRAHQSDRPGLAVAVSTGLRAGREWYAAHAELRAALARAVRDRDAALASAQEIRARLAAERQAAARARDAADRSATAMEALQAPVAAARKRWGDHVPDGPSYSETEDAALIERRERSSPWSDPEFAAARASAFWAALALHESLIRANAEVVEANLAAWTELVTGPESGAGAGAPPAEVALAAWQTFFLVVPVVSVSLEAAGLEAAGRLLDGLGPDAAGWLLADGCGGVPARRLSPVLRRVRRAVLAGSAVSSGRAASPGNAASPGSPGPECALTLAARATRYGTRLADGTWAGLPLYQPGPPPVPEADRAVSDIELLRDVLSDLRQRARSRRGTHS